VVSYVTVDRARSRFIETATVNLFPEFNHLADKSIIALSGSAIFIQLALGTEFNAEGSPVRHAFSLLV
jgi:hypothetical protein